MYSVIIPVYNGAAYVEATVLEIQHFLKTVEEPYEFIFVDDGSTDATYVKLQSLQKQGDLPWLRLVHYKRNKGKGAAVKKGYEEISVQTDAVAFTDVELPYGLEAIKQGFDMLHTDRNVAMVYATRTKAGEKRRQYSLYRKIGTTLFHLLLPKRIRSISDTQSGLKLFALHAAQEVFSRVKTNRWVFDIELFLIAQINSFKIKELPVSLKPSCITPRGGVHFLRHGWRVLFDIIRIRYYARSGIYKKT